MADLVNTHLDQKKLSALKENLVSGIWADQERKRKVEQVKALIQNALFLAQDEERKQRWLETVEGMDQVFLDELSGALIRENLRFKKGKSEILNFLQKGSLWKEPARPVSDPLVRKGDFSFAKRSSLGNMEKIFENAHYDFRDFNFSSPKEGALEAVFAGLATVILRELFWKKEEYLSQRGKFLQKLQSGLPTVALEEEEKEVVQILIQARALEDSSQAAREIVSFWTLTVPALDAVAFPELQKNLPLLPQ